MTNGRKVSDEYSYLPPIVHRKGNKIDPEQTEVGTDKQLNNETESQHQKRADALKNLNETVNL